MKKLIQEAEICGECGKPTKYEVYEHYCDNCGERLTYNKSTGYNSVNITFNNNKREEPEFCDYFCYSKWLIENADRLREKELMFLFPPTLTVDTLDQYLEIIWGIAKKSEFD